MIEVRVGARGELVIPKRVRERYGIRPNTMLTLHEGTNTIELRPKTLNEQVDEVYARWEKLRKPVDPKVWKKAIESEPYEDEE